jgi:hypothetical protein
MFYDDDLNPSKSSSKHQSIMGVFSYSSDKSTIIREVAVRKNTPLIPLWPNIPDHYNTRKSGQSISCNIAYNHPKSFQIEDLLLP